MSLIDTTSKSITVSRQIGLVIRFLFSLVIVYSIAISVIDGANARFGAIAFGFSAVLFSSPLAAKMWSKRAKLFAWLVDFALIAGFIFSGWWFYAVKEDQWTGFYTATPANVAAGIIGIVILLEMCRRAWGWALVRRNIVKHH